MTRWDPTPAVPAVMWDASCDLCGQPDGHWTNSDEVQGLMHSPFRAGVWISIKNLRNNHTRPFWALKCLPRFQELSSPAGTGSDCRARSPRTT